MLIGLTGGIAAGKSTVLSMLERAGAHIIDADKVAREVVAPGTDASRALLAEFGERVFTANGQLDRAALAELVFDDDEAYARLTAIQYPLITEAIREKTASITSQDPSAVVVLDAPMLLESGIAREVDEVWVVTAPEAKRIERARVRSGLTPDQVLARIRRQVSERERLAGADRIIVNDGSITKLETQVAACWCEIKEKELTD